MPDFHNIHAKLIGNTANLTGRRFALKPPQSFRAFKANRITPMSMEADAIRTACRCFSSRVTTFPKIPRGSDPYSVQMFFL